MPDSIVSSTHTVIHLAIDAPDAHTLPVLVFLDDPENPVISASVAKFARYLQREGTCSYEKIRKLVISIGKLRDFYVLELEGKNLNPGDLKSLLEDFLFAFDNGTVLGWRPASSQEFFLTRSCVHDYAKFLIDQQNFESTTSERQFIDACRQSWLSANHAKKSLLFHTKKRGKKKSGGRKRLITGLRHFKPFPPHLVTPLIEQTNNVRDKLLFAIMAFGCRRLSELLHIFVSDVGTRANQLEVMLRHPTQSPMTWQSKSGKKIKGFRREYLRSEFGILPRTEHGAKPSAAGWKGIKFDDEANMSSEIYFIRGVERYLLTLHRTYLYEVRSKVPQRAHPYYFVSQSGAPLTIHAVEHQFRLACKRVEKKFGISLSSYGPHSLRHYYGFYCADILKADLLLIQKWMGHKHPSATAIYAHISPETAAEALAQAEARAKLDGRIAITSEERESIRKDFIQNSIDPIPDNWKLDSTPFGIFDTKNLRRKIR